MRNEVNVTFPAIAENASLARLIIIGVLSPLDIDTQQITEIKTVVSEAVTNAIIHGYEGNPSGIIEFKVVLDDHLLHVEVKDKGVGITDIETALQPLFTTKQEEERSGLGFMIIESFTDEFNVISEPGVGTTVIFHRKVMQ